MLEQLPKVSVITVVRNAEGTIAEAIESVRAQDYPHIEHIVIDGVSTDETLEIIKRYRDRIAFFISESDKGIYDAMNKGITRATGEIVATLNADDRYASSHAISRLVAEMERAKAEVGWGDLEYMDPKNPLRAVRHWKSSPYTPGKFARGWHPPHPTFFVRREVYEKYGTFNTEFRIAADYELMLRFLERFKVISCYVPEVIVKMRSGGVSNRSVRNILRANQESYRAWEINGLHLPLWRAILKPFSKLTQYF